MGIDERLSNHLIAFVLEAALDVKDSQAKIEEIRRKYDLMTEEEWDALEIRHFGEEEISIAHMSDETNLSIEFIKAEIRAGRIKCCRSRPHRLIKFSEMVRYRAEMRAKQEKALQDLADDAQELGLY